VPSQGRERALAEPLALVQTQTDEAFHVGKGGNAPARTVADVPTTAQIQLEEVGERREIF
jgi:hypothetical protein